MRVSFVVPAYNEAQLIGETLESILRAARELGIEHELVVANDASTDETATVARAAGARVVDVEHRQIAATRNSGARASDGDVLVFVDADTILPTATLAAALRALDGGALGGGTTTAFDGELPWFTRVLLWIGTRVMVLAQWASGCFVFCTREAFDEIGGFDETLFATEEIALSRAIKKLGRFVVLREQVRTSARKVRSHSPRELLAVLGLPFRKGRAAFRTREGLDVWYGARRSDPGRVKSPLD